MGQGRESDADRGDGPHAGMGAPVAILNAAEHAVYERARKAVDSRQRELDRARAAFEEAEFVEQAVSGEFLRVCYELWQERGLSPRGRYVIDAEGRVYHDPPTDKDTNTVADDSATK